jgi:ribonuclease E
LPEPPIAREASAEAPSPVAAPSERAPAEPLAVEPPAAPVEPVPAEHRAIAEPVATPAEGEVPPALDAGEAVAADEAIEVTVDEVEFESAPAEAAGAPGVADAGREEAVLEVAGAAAGETAEATPEAPAEAAPEAPATATAAPIIDVPAPRDLGREESAIVSSSEVATLRRATPDPSITTTTPGMPAPVLSSAADSEAVTAKRVEPTGPPPLPVSPPVPAEPAAAVEDLDATVAVTAPPLPTETRAALSPRVVTPARPTSANVGEFIGEIESRAAPTFGDALDASLALTL